jgi:hypothetical protein
MGKDVPKIIYDICAIIETCVKIGVVSDVICDGALIKRYVENVGFFMFYYTDVGACQLCLIRVLYHRDW